MANQNDVGIEERLMKLTERAAELSNLPFMDCIKEYDKLLDEIESISGEVAKTPFAALLDANLLRVASTNLFNVFRKSEMDDGERTWQKLAAHVRDKVLYDDFLTTDKNADIFKKIPNFGYSSMLPFFNPNLGSDENTASQSATGCRRKKDVLCDVKKPKQDTAKEEEEEKTIVQNMLNTILKIFDENDNEPIGYFDLVLNPHSFSASVENIFHLSFLFKDQFIRLHYNDEGTPVVSPIVTKSDKEKDEDDDDEEYEDVEIPETSSTIITLTKQDWELLVKRLEITEPMLK